MSSYYRLPPVAAPETKESTSLAEDPTQRSTTVPPVDPSDPTKKLSAYVDPQMREKRSNYVDQANHPSTVPGAGAAAPAAPAAPAAAAAPGAGAVDPNDPNWKLSAYADSIMREKRSTYVDQANHPSTAPGGSGAAAPAAPAAAAAAAAGAGAVDPNDPNWKLSAYADSIMREKRSNYVDQANHPSTVPRGSGAAAPAAAAAAAAAAGVVDPNDPARKLSVYADSIMREKRSNYVDQENHPSTLPGGSESGAAAAAGSSNAAGAAAAPADPNAPPNKLSAYVTTELREKRSGYVDQENHPGK